MRKTKRINFLTLFLLLGVIYMGINATMNVTKYISYRVKIAQLQTLHKKAAAEQESLIAEIDGYKSDEKYEELAKNCLGYAEPNCIVVKVIKNPNSKPQNLNFQY